ncbi:Uncharacterized protein Adt_35525 [Abeliophyllum distichum]|uniref:Uncharacterized protein n=1 Tax=Abeliophyllum distichum TaxID=126358 RepID=A0ABD1QIE8_9LAMI
MIFSIATASVYKYRSSLWKKTNEKDMLEELVALAAMNNARGFTLNNELQSTLIGFSSKLEKAEAKTKKLVGDLNAATKVVRKIENQAAAAELKRKNEVVARKMAEERAMAAEKNIAIVNHDYYAMVTKKKKWLAETSVELAKAKLDVRALQAEVEVWAVKAFKKYFPQMSGVQEII